MTNKNKELEIKNIPISQLKISEYNVRKHESDVSELAKSIEEQGILQPLVVRPEANGKMQYGIVIGSRRYQAAKEAKLREVPVVVHDVNENDAITISLVENLQRNDLQPKETIEAITSLRQKYTTREIGKKIGRSHIYVQNMTNLGNLVTKLEKHKMEVQILPDEKDRDAGKAIPFNHAIHLGNALDFSGVKEFFKTIDEQEAENKTIDLAKAITKEKQTDAQKILEVFKKEPEQDIDTIISDAHLGTDEGDVSDFDLSDKPTPERTELTEMGDIRERAHWLYTALTREEFMPHKHEDLIVDHIKPTREFRHGIIAGLSQMDKNGLHDWLSYTKAAIEDMLEIIEQSN